MKRYVLLVLVTVASVAVSAMSVIAASPHGRYYDQNGNKYWCNTDSYGCWVTGENGEHDYIMFWSEASRAKIMGPDSNAPLGIVYNSSEMPLKAPPTPMPTQSAPVNPPAAECDSHKDENSCTAAGCEWSAVTNSCGDKKDSGDTTTTSCGEIYDVITCGNTAGCTWLGSIGEFGATGGCFAKEAAFICSVISEKDSCNNRIDCQWNCDNSDNNMGNCCAERTDRQY